MYSISLFVYSCTIQNSVICDNVVIENNCNLNECNIGVRAKVTTGTKLRGESITASNA
jgi:ADP-glucose pyrophosphorylase